MMEKDELYREIEKTVRRHSRIEKEVAAAYKFELSIKAGENPGYTYEARRGFLVEK